MPMRWRFLALCSTKGTAIALVLGLIALVLGVVSLPFVVSGAVSGFVLSFLVLTVLEYRRSDRRRT